MVGPSGSFQSFSDINRSPEVITSTIQQDMHKSKNIYKKYIKSKLCEIHKSYLCFQNIYDLL